MVVRAMFLIKDTDELLLQETTEAQIADLMNVYTSSAGENIEANRDILSKIDELAFVMSDLTAPAVGNISFFTL